MMHQLRKFIKSLIETNGVIPLDEFMRLTISHYYAQKGSIGSMGDFITAPEISQMFGEVVGAWCACEYLRFPDKPFYLVELGAGNGVMMDDILRVTKRIKGFTSNLKGIVILESSQYLRAKQADMLSKHIDKIMWIDNIQNLPKGNLIIVANEFLDALPIKQFQKVSGAFYEIGIGLKGEQFCYVQLSLTDFPSSKCPEGGVVEVCLPAFDIVKALAKQAKFGYISALFIDYGYFTPTFKSTIQAVKNHEYHDIFTNIGEADLTAHVDFGSLAKFLEASGMEILRATQKEFLCKNGIEFRAKKLVEAGAKGVEVDLNRLIADDQMGELFKVLEARSSRLIYCKSS
jgi:SAM-dependent MidA family methyltransferase